MKSRVLLQNRRTLLYLTPANNWDSDSRDALDFQTRVRASDFLIAEDLPEAQIVLHLPTPNAGDAAISSWSGPAESSRFIPIEPSEGSLSVLHVESSPNWGGQESRTVIETAWLNRHGFRAWIAADPDSEIFKRARQQNLPVTPVAMGFSWNPVSIGRLLKFASDHSIDIINTHSSKDSWLCLPMHLAGWPVVRWRNVIIPVPNKRSKRFPYTHACRQVIATADAIRDDLCRRTGVPREKIEVIGEGIDLDKFHPGVAQASSLRRELGLHAHQPLIGMVALMRPEKGHAHFLEAALQVLRTHPEARFVIAGGSNRGYGKCRIEMALQARLSAECEQHRAAVHFLGLREDVPNILAGIDILVVPSISEARCRVLGEGMAMRKAIIASRIGGMTELIREGTNGLFFPPGDYLALADAVRSLIDDEDKRSRLAEAAYRTAQAELSMDTVMRQTISCYSRLLRNRPADLRTVDKFEVIAARRKGLEIAFN